MKIKLINNCSFIKNCTLKVVFLLLCTAVFSFNTENSFSQETVIIDQDQLVSVDQVFKIIKEQTTYRFMYPNDLFKYTPKVQLKKGQIMVDNLLKKSLSGINFNFEITKGNNIIIKKNVIVKNLKQQKKPKKKEVTGFVFDETTGESLPYATIRLLNTKYYTITNEDGKFEFLLDDNIEVNFLEIRFLGFVTKKISVSYFNTETKVYLTPHISSIDEVLITYKKRDKNYTYNLLYNVVEKYRKSTTNFNSKAFLSLTSSTRNIPIEHIEGFYNSSQNLSKGIINLNIKSGRFGQNKLFSYYSLDNTTILKNFQLFNKPAEQILPLYPGNMTLSRIKSKYIVKIDECTNCEENDMSISFFSKKTNQRLFDGKIIFNQKTSTIKKIELYSTNPKTHGLSSLSNDHVFTPKKIKLNILFNPLDLSKIQHIDFTFDMQYTTPTFSELINCNTFLYFYDYDYQFEKPHFTKNVAFKNDYDKIVALQSSDEFWGINYQFPKSYNDERDMRFLEQHGYLINYESTIPLDYIEYVKPSVIEWSNTKRINWRSIKKELVKKKIKKDGQKIYNYQQGREADNQLYSISEINTNMNKKVNEKLNFSYALDIYYDREGSKKVTSKTILDRNSSYSKNQRTKNKRIYFNLMFDIYEYYRQGLDPQKKFLDQMSNVEIKKMYDNKFLEASETVKKMAKETNFGTSYQRLIKWNNNIKSKMRIDNYQLIAK